MGNQLHKYRLASNAPYKRQIPSFCDLTSLVAAQDTPEIVGGMECTTCLSDSLPPQSTRLESRQHLQSLALLQMRLSCMKFNIGHNQTWAGCRYESVKLAEDRSYGAGCKRSHPLLETEGLKFLPDY